MRVKLKGKNEMKKYLLKMGIIMLTILESGGGGQSRKNYLTENNEKIIDNEMESVHNKKLEDEIQTCFDMTKCINEYPASEALFTNGFTAEKDSVLMGVETIASVGHIDVYIAEGNYDESHTWRGYAENVRVENNNVAYISSYNLKVKKGDEVYIRFSSGVFKYSNEIENHYKALRNIKDESTIQVDYFVSFNLILLTESNEYDLSSDIMDLNICAVGDSLTQGMDRGIHEIMESYPFYLSRSLGSRVLNYGQAGTTVKTWWDTYKDMYVFDETLDVVLIMFGTNGGLLNNTLSTDVEPYEDWRDYAETNCGCYCKLIEKIMKDTKNHAQIVLLTPPYSTFSEEQTKSIIGAEPVIRAIAKRYNIPVIDVLNESGMNQYNAEVFRPYDGCHFNAKGYHKLGTFIGSQLKSLLSTFDNNEMYDDEIE